MSGADHAVMDVHALVDALFDDIKQRGELTDDHLVTLHFFFSEHLPAALELLDKCALQRVRGVPSGRTFVEASGNRGNRYTVLHNYCTCRNYTFSVLNRADSLACKHLVAARLLDALGGMHTEDVPDGVFGARMLGARTSPASSGNAVAAAAATLPLSQFTQ